METKRRTGTREWSDKSLNLQLGCNHNCIYCYARANALRFKRINSRDDWEHPRIYTNFEKPYIFKGRIMCPTSHDITKENIRQAISVLTDWLALGNQFLIVSKPHIAIIKQLCDAFENYKTQITFRFTIGSTDSDVLKFWEPNAPDFTERMQSLKYAYKKGYVTSVSCEPYLDCTIKTLVDAVSSYVNDTIWVGKMNGISNRVDMTNWGAKEKGYLERLQNCQTDDYIKELYSELNSNPKVRWKDSIKKILDLPEEEIG